MANDFQKAKHQKAYKKIVEEGSGEVEMYRAYGVTKKVRTWNIFLNEMLATLLFIIVMGLAFILIAMGTTAWLAMGGKLFTTLFIICFTTFVVLKFTRVPRGRSKFIRRLKKLCKKYNYRYVPICSFWEGFSYDYTEGIDFVLHAGLYTYYVKYVTPSKALTSFTFLSKNEMRYTKHARKNTFSLMLGRKDKSKLFPIKFPPNIPEKDEFHKRVMLINPRPRDILVKNELGVTVPTGSGDSSMGYVIQTGTGFLNQVLRDNKK